MTTGANYNAGFSTAVMTESFDVVASTTCQSLPDYPLEGLGATGAFVNNKVVICGGTGGTNCYTLGRNEKTWTLIGNMIAYRAAAAAVAFNNKLVIFGGYDPDNNRLLSTEEIDVDTGTATAGPDMPFINGFHCAVKLDAKTALIIGGVTDDRTSTYFYDANAKTFTSGPSLMQGRGEHACAILDTGTERYVVASGGWLNGWFDSTEILDLNQPTLTWMTGL